MLLQEEREKIVEYGQEMLKRGLTAGTFGNLSIYLKAPVLTIIFLQKRPYISSKSTQRKMLKKIVQKMGFEQAHQPI